MANERLQMEEDAATRIQSRRRGVTGRRQAIQQRERVLYLRDQRERAQRGRERAALEGRAQELLLRVSR